MPVATPHHYGQISLTWDYSDTLAVNDVRNGPEEPARGGSPCRSSVTRYASLPKRFGLGSYQLKVFLVTWAGWALDSTDFGLFSFVLRPAVTSGPLTGGQIYNLVGPYGWRALFFVGIAPALLLLFLRRGMPEPDHFSTVRDRRATLKAAGQLASHADREFMRFPFLQLFSRELRFNTLVGLLFCVGTLLSIWTSLIWLPTIQSLLLQQ